MGRRRFAPPGPVKTGSGTSVVNCVKFCPLTRHFLHVVAADYRTDFARLEGPIMSPRDARLHSQRW
jgi:hypothetical protein